MSDSRAGTTGALEQGGGLAETVSEQATKAKDKGRRELRDQLDERTTQLGHQARSLAETLRRSGVEAKVQGSDEPGVERITSGVADRLERAGGYLERANGDEMLRDAEQFVRTRPWVVAGAAAAAGLLASRIFKASSERRYDESTNTSNTASAPGTRPASGTYGGASVGGQPVAAAGRAS
jgi:ElaB/YqjD/DUF883 family membrane-anchored ribosome-binding protein